jgi:5'(3')-deoxyribonucleotidase
MEFKIREEKPKIAIDIDETLASTMQVIIKEFNSKTGSRYTIEEMDDWNKGIDKIFGNYENFLKFYNYVWEYKIDEIASNVSKELLSELAKHYDIVIISNRPKEDEKSRRKWLEKHFEGIKFEVKMVEDVYDKLNKEYSIIIDDASPVAEKFEKENEDKGRVFLLVAKPWNTKLKTNKAIRVNNTEEAIKYAIEIRQEEKNKKVFFKLK